MIINYLESGITPKDTLQAQKVIGITSHMVIQNNCLYYSLFSQNNRKRKDLSLRIVVPQELIEEVMYENHENKFAGHFGFNKTYEKIKKKILLERYV